MAILKIFKNRIPNSNYVTKQGKQINFVNGIHMTDNEKDVEELTDEYKSGNPHIYIDENEQEVDTNAATPMQILKQKMREEVVAEILAEQAAATDKTNDRGTTPQDTKLQGIANSTTVADSMAGSDSSNAGSQPAPAAPVGTASDLAIGAAPAGIKAAMMAKLGKPA